MKIKKWGETPAPLSKSEAESLSKRLRGDCEDLELRKKATRELANEEEC